MAKTDASTSTQPPASRGSAMRTLAPLAPLAIALVHQGMVPRPTPPTAPAAPTTTVTAQASPAPILSAESSTSIPPCGSTTPCAAPLPMLAKDHPVNWWFVFKFNVSKFPGCGGGSVACPFGGTAQSYKPGLQYAFASNEAPTLAQGGKDCLGDTTADPVGATYDEVYNGSYHYVVWNDQFYSDPSGAVSCNGDGCDAPWGHSKGMIAWNDNGEGLVMQVSTPSWPGAGNARHPRSGGNTLGCVKDDDVKVSQHFFALRLSHDDLAIVLDALANASVVTDTKNPQIVSSGGPSDIQAKVAALGQKSSSSKVFTGTLSSGVEIISKPSNLHVPPWQMVSSVLSGVSLRTATWWDTPPLPSTPAGAVPACWDSSLPTAPGAVDIATSGTWNGTTFSLKGGISPDANHAKLGVSTSGDDHYAIFGDENQQGVLSGDCTRAQNGRGGTFYVMENPGLSASLTALLAGTTAPSQ